MHKTITTAIVIDAHDVTSWLFTLEGDKRTNPQRSGACVYSCHADQADDWNFAFADDEIRHCLVGQFLKDTCGVDMPVGGANPSAGNLFPLKVGLTTVEADEDTKTLLGKLQSFADGGSHKPRPWGDVFSAALSFDLLNS